MIIIAVATVVSLAGSSVASAATNLVIDGQFETAYNGADGSQLDDWTVGGSIVRVFNDADNPDGLGMWTDTTSGNGWDGGTASGDGYFVALDGAYPTIDDNGWISQMINGLTIGQAYTLSFNYGFAQERMAPDGENFNGDTIDHLTATIGSTSWDSGDTLLSSHGFVGWNSATVNFTASSTSELLKFVGFASSPQPAYALLSDVSIIAAAGAVPEPATWAMMIVGFFGMGALARRRSQQFAAA